MPYLFLTLGVGVERVEVVASLAGLGRVSSKVGGGTVAAVTASAGTAAAAASVLSSADDGSESTVSSCSGSGS